MVASLNIIKTAVLPGGDSSVSPGSDITYTITVANTGDTDATNTLLSDSLDSNTTWTSGILDVTPIARNDEFVGDQGILISVDAAAGVLGNDVDPDGGLLTISEVQGAAVNVGAQTTTTQGGSVTVAADGSFSYMPPTGFTGVDTFEYTVLDDEGHSDPAMVSLNIIEAGSTLPAMVPSTGGMTQIQSNGNNIEVSLGTLNDAQVVTLEFQVTVNDPLPLETTLITNTVTVVADDNISETDQATTAIALLPEVGIFATDSTASENPIDTASYTLSRTGNLGDLQVLLDLDFGTVTGLTTADFSLTGGNIALNGTTAIATIPDGVSSVDITLIPVDDAVAENLETLTLTIAPNLAYTIDGSTGTAAITIADDDAAALTLTLAPNTISENNGSAIATLTRNTDAVGELIVDLSSSDLNAATVPTQVTINDGASSTTFQVTGVDDASPDGTQTAIITAAAPGFADSSAIINVTDNDVPIASLRFEAEDINNVMGYRLEGNSAASDGQMLSLLGFGGPEVGMATFLFSGATGAYDIELGTFDEKDGTANFVIEQNGVQIGSTIVLDQNTDGSNGANSSTKVTRVVGNGIQLFNGATIQITGFEQAGEHARFDFIEFTPANGGSDTPPTAANDTAMTDEASPVGINVLANDTGSLPLQILEVDGNVIIVDTPITLTSGALLTLDDAGSLNYDPNGAFDALNTGETATDSFDYLVSNAVGISEATATVTINGLDPAVLALTITPDTLSENGDSATATVTRTTGTTGDLIVTLINDDATAVTVPTAVIIPDGAVAVDFIVAPVDDTAIDGTQTASITATADDFADAIATVDVTDDEAPLLTLTVTPNSIVENGGTAVGTLTRNTTGPLTVNLFSNDSGEATVPTTVTFGETQTSSTVLINAVDDVVADGTQVVTVTAAATGFEDATASLAVTDNEVALSAVLIEAEDINSADVTGYRIENKSIASGGSMLSLLGSSGNEVGTASFNFNGTGGTYEVSIGTFDENDGAATFLVEQNNSAVGNIVLNENPGGNGASANTKKEIVVDTLTINPGDTFKVTGTEVGGEHARFDFIRFEPVASISPTPPSITTSNAFIVLPFQTNVVDIDATDTNGDTEANGLTYSFSGGADQAQFSLDTNTGVLSFINPPDFATPADNNGDNVYEVAVTVTDSTNLTDTQIFNITVGDVLIDQFDHIVSHFDGNAADTDDIGALGMAALLLNAAGLEDKSTIFYNNLLGLESVPEQVALMRQSAAYAEKLGVPTYDYERDYELGTDQATQALVEILNSGQKVLSLEGGAMEAIYRALEQTSPQNRGNITLVSHSRVNENENRASRPGVEDVRTWDEILEDFPEVSTIQITNQNFGNFNDGGDSRGFANPLWTWLDSTSDPLFQEVRQLMQNSGIRVNDVSDAGMHFFAITGNEVGDPLDAQAFFNQNPPAVGDDPVLIILEPLGVEESQTTVVDVDAYAPNGDSEGSGLSYSLSGGADQAAFAIAADTGILTFNTAPDFEAPSDSNSDNVYEVQVTVTDSTGLTDTQGLAIPVTDIFETVSPTITSPDSVTVAENQTGAIDVNATDAIDAEGAGLSYAVTGGADAALFSIDSLTGIVSFNAAPDFESPADSDTDNSYELQVTVQDTSGLSDTQAITVTVTDEAENAAPTITSPADVTVVESQTSAIDVNATDAIDAEGAGLSYAVTGGADAALFSIDSLTGIVSFNAAPDFESPADSDTDNSYELQVTVQDTSGLSDTQAITVTVTDEAENAAPTITSPADVTVVENQTGAIDVNAADAIDAEGAGLSYAVTGGADAALFSIDSLTGIVSFNAAPDFESPADSDTDNSYELQVTVQDTSGLSDTQAITVTVTDEAENAAPTITSPADVTVAENQTGAIDVNATDAIDAEGAGLSYAVTGGADAALFSIDSLTGIVSFNAAPDFESPADSDTDNSYELTVAVANSAALSSTQNITVTVTDVDDTSFPIRIEAESVNDAVNYRLENIGVASGGQVLSFRGFPSNEVGSATFVFNGVSDSYDILLGTFDENDGASSFTVELNDFETGVTTEIGSLALTQNLGSGLANAKTFITPTVASNIGLTPGDTIIVNGFEQGSEHARLDYIDFIPVI